MSIKRVEARHTKRHIAAFTIVELLIVVVVIAILATLVAVAYNGITDQAKSSTTQSQLSSAIKKIQIYAVENGDEYPNTLTKLQLENTNSTEYRYSYNNSTTPKTFCITAISTDYSKNAGDTSSSKSFTADSSSSTPRDGRCVGHEDENYMSNYMPNSGFERDLKMANREMEPGWYVYTPGIAIERAPDAGVNSSTALKVTKQLGATGRPGYEYTFLLQSPKVAYKLLAKTRTDEVLSDPRDGLAIGVSMSNSHNGYFNQVNTATFTTRSVVSDNNRISTSDYSFMQFNFTQSSPANIAFFIDNIMIVESDYPQTPDYEYRDGDSDNWIWNSDGSSRGPRP